jgi:hypothetical protein
LKNFITVVLMEYQWDSNTGKAPSFQK